MSKLTSSAFLCLLLSGCFGTPAPILIRHPAPPVWSMDSCPDWPAMAGSGRVEFAELAGAIVEAKAAHADCQARHEALRRYVTDIVRPE